MNVLFENEENQSNSTPSCILTGSETTILALVSKSAVFVKSSDQVVELSVVPSINIVGFSLVTLTPGTLTITVSIY